MPLGQAYTVLAATMRWHMKKKKDQLPNQGGPIHQAEVAFKFPLLFFFF